MQMQLSRNSVFGRQACVVAASGVGPTAHQIVVEIGQLQGQYTNVFDFSAYPNVRRWLSTMQQVGGHDTVHVVLAELGDISQTAPDMDQIRGANIKALQALKLSLSTL